MSFASRRERGGGGGGGGFRGRGLARLPVERDAGGRPHGAGSTGARSASVEDQQRYPSTSFPPRRPFPRRESDNSAPSVDVATTRERKKFAYPTRKPKSPAAAAAALELPFEAEFNDHFETSLDALRDVVPVIDSLKQLTRPMCPEKFCLYDPYYCAGGIVAKWRSLGISHVIHEKRDFYADIANNTVPSAFDMLVTNPPFSGDHLPRCFRFLFECATRPEGSSSGPRLQAFAVLCPDYIAEKAWYQELVEEFFAPDVSLASCKSDPLQDPALPTDRHKQKSRQAPPEMGQKSSLAQASAWSAAFLTHPALAGAGTVAAAPTPPPVVRSESASHVTRHSSSAVKTVREPFYIEPRAVYDFENPLGAGHGAASHFKSMWFVWCGRRTEDVLRELRFNKAYASATDESKTPGDGAAGRSRCFVHTGLAGFARARRMAARRRAIAAAAIGTKRSRSED